MEIILPDSAQVECKRCSECCKTGGPSLQLKDAELLKNGALTYKDIYTIREGELVYNNISNELVAIDYELVKMKEKDNSRICIFLKEDENECTIYDNRPIQCREQECWNPSKLERAFLEEKLTREHLIKGNNTLIDIIERHDEKCSYSMVNELFKRVQDGEDLVGDILEVLQYDTYIRPSLEEKMGIPTEYIPLLLGRPLTDTIEMFGYKVEKDEDGNYSLIIL